MLQHNRSTCLPSVVTTFLEQEILILSTRPWSWPCSRAYDRSTIAWNPKVMSTEWNDPETATDLPWQSLPWRFGIADSVCSACILDARSFFFLDSVCGPLQETSGLPLPLIWTGVSDVILVAEEENNNQKAQFKKINAPNVLYWFRTQAQLIRRSNNIGGNESGKLSCPCCPAGDARHSGANK